MVKQPPQASAGVVQDSLSMNCQPMQLFDELERHLQKNWESAILTESIHASCQLSTLAVKTVLLR